MIRSRPLYKMASTKAGMRRILKYKDPVATYIEKAVKAGTYRTNEELEQVWKERRESADDLSVVMRRFRQDIVRGSDIQDYPIEYLILKQHPPIPDPPRIPKKLEKRMKPPPNPTERLVKRYLRRFEGSASSSGPKSKDSANNEEDGVQMTTDDYYRRLLGIPAPKTQTALGSKTAAVQKAYAAAIKHYQLQRTQGLSEREALKQVDALLVTQEETERKLSRNRVKQAKEAAQEAPITTETYRSAIQDDADGNEEHVSQSKLTSIFTKRQLTAMMHWSERLQAVPYGQWTIGASTALDHWIARQVLRLSEETWQLLLEGSDPKYLDIGRNIVTVRETLFPETILSLERKEEGAVEDSLPKSDPEEKSIEELLASIGGIKTEEEPIDARVRELDDVDAKLESIMTQLQSWRHLNQQTPYGEWKDDDKSKFDSFLKEYITLSDSKMAVDLDATRDALLASPPLSRDDFWSDEDAHDLLDRLRVDGPPESATILHKAFWSLGYDEQLERLQNIGALRPLIDEYTKEADRTDFVRRYGDTLLSGVEMEHLVEDPDGPITAADIGPAGADLPAEARFRIEMREYRSGADLSAEEKTRTLFLAWNQHKSGRARYEEKLFTTGRLGLKYSDKIPREKGLADDDDE